MTPEELGQTYTLTCEKCGQTFYSTVAFPASPLCLTCQQKQRIREAIARIICCLADKPNECAYCNRAKGCPDTWRDLSNQVDQILSTLHELGYRQIPPDSAILENISLLKDLPSDG